MTVTSARAGALRAVAGALRAAGVSRAGVSRARAGALRALAGLSRAVAGWVARRPPPAGTLRGTGLACGACAAAWFSAGTRPDALVAACVLCACYLAMRGASRAGPPGAGAAVSALAEFGVCAGLAAGAPPASGPGIWVLAAAVTGAWAVHDTAVVCRERAHRVTAGPGMTAPGVTSPGMTAPAVAGPAVAGPAVAAPGVAAPGVAGPGVAAPGVAGPGVTAPGVAVPGVAVPGVTGARNPAAAPRAPASPGRARGVGLAWARVRGLALAGATPGTPGRLPGARIALIMVVAPAWGGRVTLTALLGWEVIAVAAAVASRPGRGGGPAPRPAAGPGARVPLSALLARGSPVVTGVTGGVPVAGTGWPAACRDDGRFARWTGRILRGQVAPLPPALVGLAAVILFAWPGLRGLPDVLALAPVAALLLAAPGAGHAHDGAADWLVPALVHTGEYVYIAVLGPAAGVPGPLVFTLVGMTAVTHRAAAATGAAPAGDVCRPWPWLGWEGRILAAGISVPLGLATLAYGALTAYLGLALGRTVLSVPVTVVGHTVTGPHATAGPGAAIMAARGTPTEGDAR